MKPHHLSHLSLIVLLAAFAAGGGCNYMAYMGQALQGDEEVTEVEADYRGLEGKSIAVMVAADEYVLFTHPDAQIGVARAVSARLADNMPSVIVMDPAKVVQFQAENPYWYAIPYSELIQKMDVDAIVLIDLVEYQTHEPGNKYIWQGIITGNVGVILADAENPDDFVYYTTVRALFPEDRKVGVVDANNATIQLGMHSIFSRDAAGLFYDHSIVRPN